QFFSEISNNIDIFKEKEIIIDEEFEDEEFEDIKEITKEINIDIRN
ncbi:44826_t:CDS:1, partial [Gigaspora margarita]